VFSRRTGNCCSSYLLGPFETLRHLKKDVTELRKGIEGGLSIKGFDAFREGDLIQTYSTIEKPGQL
jgi:translation initiation factor IF-2